MALSSITPEIFRRACSKFATGVTITTVIGPEGQPHGLTANSFTSVSCCPPLVLICLDRRCNILPYFEENSHFGINVLAEEQRDLSVRFARRGEDRFDNISWGPGETGVPLLAGALATLECRIRQKLDAGDHTLIIGEVIHSTIRDGRPLLFFNSSYQRLVQ